MNKNIQLLTRKNRINVREPLKNLGMVLFFVFLFPYSFSLLLGKVEPTVVEIEDKEEKKVTIQTSIGIEHIPLQEYLIGGLAATIPVDYHIEALKAQGIILHTNIEVGNQSNYLSILQLEEKWGTDFTENYNKLKNVIMDIQEVIVTYEGSIVSLPYFSISVGNTRSGVEVFQSNEYPYLQSVNSKNDIFAEKYLSERVISKKEILDKLEIVFENKENETSDFLKVVERDQAGYVLEAKIGEVLVSGEKIKEELQLPSSSFEITEQEDSYLFRVKGVGHGIGFSQYGANQLAEEGKDCLTILNHYYTNIEIEKQ